MSERGPYDKSTKRDILDAALTVWPDVTLRNVARAANLVHGTVFYHFQDDLKDAVAAHAIAVGNRATIQKMIVEGHELTDNMTPEERQSWFEGV